MNQPEPPDGPEAPDSAEPAGPGRPLDALGSTAKAGIAEAAGADGIDKLLTRQSSSDGSLQGDTQELVENASAGAKLGGKVGAAPGAAIGAAAGTVLTAAKNKRTRKRLVIVLTAPTLAGVLAWTMVIVALGSIIADNDQRRDGLSQTAALADGVTDDQVDVYRTAADSSGVSWMLLAAVDRSAGMWAGPGDPPYGIVDLAAFNADLARHGLDPLTPDQAADRVAAGYAYGRLFAAKLAETDNGLDAEDLAAGAGVMTDPADVDRQILAVNTDDPDAVGAHEHVQSAFVATLAGMPSSTAGDASAIFDAAYRWAIGQAQDCTGDPFATVAGDPSVPRPTGTGVKLDVAAASWNTLYTNSTSRVAAGIRALGVSADVIGLQELGSSRRRAAVQSGIGADWVMYAGGNGNNTTPIVWKRSRYDLLAYGAVLGSGVVRIEPGASGTALGPRWITWVQLRDKSSGGAFIFVNTHLIPDAGRDGRPDSRRPERVAVYNQEMTRLLALVDKLKASAPVVGTMDGNIDARADARTRDPRWPYVRMGQHGVYSNWRVLGMPSTGTHGHILIDYVWSTTSTIIQTGQRIGPTFGSDHNSLLVTLTTRPSSSTSDTADDSAAVSNSTGTSGSAAVPDRLTVPGPTGGSTMTLTGEQVSNASIVIAEGKAANVPMQGWVIALAAALQESGIRNLSYGDRDSQGMFQQRPSSGWGTVDQIRDPHLAAQAFYGVAKHTNNPGLTDVAGWQDMTVADAAQAVQRSAFPSAYAKWEAAARAIVQRLAGVTDPAALAAASSTCTTVGSTSGGTADCPATGLPAEQGLTPDALLVLRCSKRQFPQLATFYGVGQRPENSDSDHPSGRAVDLMIPDYATPAGSSLGWQIANWLRDHHAELGVHYVIFAAKIWNVDRDAEGWRDYASVTGHDDPTSLHYDHVHVSVFGDQATPAAGDGPSLAAGAWTMPIPKGSYRIGCAFGCYAGHTGQDFPVPAGTTLRSSDDGVVIRSEALRDSAGHYRSYGNLIVVAVDGDPGTTVWYAHLSRRDVTVGQHVRAGQQLGATGYTGHVIPSGPAGAHLHYEIRVDGSPVNPMPILRRHGVTP